MARKLSRRTLATYIANELIDGTPSKTLAQRLAAYLIENRRTKEMSIIVRDISYLLAEQGYVDGSITTSHELSTEALDNIKAYVKKKTNAKQVVLTTNIDQSVLGGLKLQTPGFEFDVTAKRQLSLLKTRFRQT